MATEDDSVDWPGRWENLSKVLLRPGPFAHPEFEPGPEIFEQLHMIKLLVVGAGGLGCELLKNLALMGFRNLHVIDMDTIDISNLNRQFLFRISDVDRPKAEVAAASINARIPGCHVTPHYCQIQDKDEGFYQSFNLVICGLDSIIARRWINSMIVGLLDYKDDGAVQPSTIIPIIDGGTEAFRGNARVILPGLSPCIECTLSLFPPQVNFPLCTLAHTPRLPEHCVEYVRMILWEKEAPFANEAIDGDNPKHVQWILAASQRRADEYGIRGVTYRLAQGVIKHIIPAVASTNAVIAAACAMEAFKLATNCALPMSNYMNFSDTDGVFAGVVEMEKRDDCPVCSNKRQKLTFARDAKLQHVVDHLKNSPDFQMKSPALTTSDKTLYMPSIPSLEKATRNNLKLTLTELGLKDGEEIAVADATTPQSLLFLIHFFDPMDSQ